ncbi:MAG: WhiB family transcriptional regulator [Acidimicrobiales bacterium]
MATERLLERQLAEASATQWMADAACRESDVALFFPEPGPGSDVSRDAAGADEARAEAEARTQTAKAICAACPVRQKCLDFALVTRQEDGIWGGLDEAERRRFRRRRQEAARAARRPGQAA